MSNIIPTFQRTNGSSWVQYSVANPAGGSAGASVAVSVTCQDSVLPPSGQYTVDIELGQDATWYITGKSSAGFTVNLQPRLASATLAAGVFNARVTW